VEKVVEDMDIEEGSDLEIEYEKLDNELEKIKRAVGLAIKFNKF
jgi:hypothetical protein